jgi:uncharacterized membrane protein (DUF373 family)
MIGIEDIKQHYFFTKADESNLEQAGKIISPYADQFASDFYDYLLNFPEAIKFFRTQEAIEKRKETIKRWMLMLFEGKYDNRYLSELERIGVIHVKREIPIHWVAASMNFKRDYLINVLNREVQNKEEFQKFVRSLEKLLDINLDIMTSSYHEQEIKKIFLTKQMDSVLIKFAERFTYGLNLVLILALIGLSLGVIALFFVDVYAVLLSGGVEKGILSLLGTLLIIWVMIELMGTEIKYLKGDRFHIEIFVSVALVAVIRELLIATLSHESVPTLAVLLAAILVLGIVYYLISHTEIIR